MKEFPKLLDVRNKEKFKEFNYNRTLCYLRKNIYEHIIGNDENNYFVLDNLKATLKDEKTFSQMVGKVVEELNILGWKCKISFGGTALFIYSSDKPPPSCWDDDGHF